MFLQYYSLELTILRSRTPGRHADPVEIAGQLLGDIGLPPGRKANCHDQGGTVGHTYWNETWRRERSLSHVLITHNAHEDVKSISQ